MYDYQEEIIDSIDDAVYKIEEMTEEHYRLQIGWRYASWENVPIFVEINGRFRFTQRTNYDENHDCYSKCELRNYSRIEIYDDVFLDLNKIIDKVIKDNKKRKEYYEKLSANLGALNKTLDEFM